VTELNPGRTSYRSISDAVKSWVVVLLTLVFIVLYGFALLGKLRPLADISMVTRLEPLVFIVIGYYFGRLPGEENEQTLKDEIGRQTRRADAAQQATEVVLQSREALDEKIKNARTALDNAPTERSYPFDHLDRRFADVATDECSSVVGAKRAQLEFGRAMTIDEALTRLRQCVGHRSWSMRENDADPLVVRRTRDVMQ